MDYGGVWGKGSLLLQWGLHHLPVCSDEGREFTLKAFTDELNKKGVHAVGSELIQLTSVSTRCPHWYQSVSLLSRLCCHGNCCFGKGYAPDRKSAGMKSLLTDQLDLWKTAEAQPVTGSEGSCLSGQPGVPFTESWRLQSQHCKRV